MVTPLCVGIPVSVEGMDGVDGMGAWAKWTYWKGLVGTFVTTKCNGVAGRWVLAATFDGSLFWETGHEREFEVS